MNRLKVFSFCWKGRVKHGSTVAGKRRLQLDQVQKSTNDDHVFGWLVNRPIMKCFRCVKCGCKTIRIKFLSLCLSSAIFTHLVMEYCSNFFDASIDAFPSVNINACNYFTNIRACNTISFMIIMDMPIACYRCC